MNEEEKVREINEAKETKKVKEVEEVKVKTGVDTSKIKNALVNFVVPLIAFGVMGALGFAVLYPTVTSLSDLKAELVQKQDKRDTLESKVASLKRLIDFKSVVLENSELINKVLVPEDDVLALQDQIQQITQSSGLAISKLAYSSGETGETESGNYELVGVSMTALGNYGQLVAFMDLVENAARFVRVSNFRYAISTEEETAGMLTVAFSLESPYLDVESQAVVDDPLDLDITSSEFVSFINKLKGLKYYSFEGPTNISTTEDAEGTEEEGLFGGDEPFVPGDTEGIPEDVGDTPIDVPLDVEEDIPEDTPEDTGDIPEGFE